MKFYKRGGGLQVANIVYYTLVFLGDMTGQGEGEAKSVASWTVFFTIYLLFMSEAPGLSSIFFKNDGKGLFLRAITR